MIKENSEIDENIYMIGIDVTAVEDQDIIDYDNQHFVVKTGDKGVLNSKGEIHWLTGECANKTQTITGVTGVYDKFKGYEIENVINLISKEISENDKEKNLSSIRKVLEIILCNE